MKNLKIHVVAYQWKILKIVIELCSNQQKYLVLLNSQKVIEA